MCGKFTLGLSCSIFLNVSWLSCYLDLKCSACLFFDFCDNVSVHKLTKGF